MTQKLKQIELCGRPIFISEGHIEQNIAFEDTTNGLFELTLDLFTIPDHCLYNPILVGGTGIGKTTMVRKLSQVLKKPLYTIVGNDEISPEDLLITASLNEAGTFDYIASPLASAMLTGGICFIDEIGKLRHRSMAVLASVLDRRREALSNFLGCNIPAHPDFRFIAATNTSDLEKFDLPDWMKTRLLPYMEYPMPSFLQIQKILEVNLKNPLSESEKKEFEYMKTKLQEGRKFVSPAVVVRCWELYAHLKEKAKKQMKVAKNNSEKEEATKNIEKARDAAIKYVTWDN